MLKTRKFICHAIMIALILAMAVPVFAEAPSGGDAQPYELGNLSISFDRNSNTAARSVMSAVVSAVATTITGTLTLEEKRDGRWVVASGVSPVMQSLSSRNDIGLYMINDWNLQKGKNYRLKVSIVDTINGNTSTYTAYSNTI